MIFTRLVLTNFGVYRGTNEFDLRPCRSDGMPRPVVLIEGQNGAGKTTLLEAVRLCLYGQSALGARVRRADYEAFIRQRFHRDTRKESGHQASIQLEFEHTHAGKRSIYDAVRSWQREGDVLRETVSLFKDGHVLQEIAEEHWNDFLRDLIPPGVADLFFFDGEKIQALADETTSTSALETAIRGLLNLDLIERLRADLGVYLRQKERQDRSRMEQQLEDARKAYEHADQQCRARKQDLAGLQSRLDRTLDQLDKARQKLLREGAGFIQRREALEQRQKEVEREREETRVALRDLAQGLLPFAVSPAWCVQLRERLERERRAEQSRMVHETRHALAAHVAVTLLNPTFQQETAPHVDAQVWARIASRVQALIQPSPNGVAVDVRHPLSSEDRTTLIEWIETATQQIPHKLHLLTLRMEQQERELSELAQTLRQVPDAAVATPLIEEFHQLAEEKGRLQEQIVQSKQHVRHEEVQRAERERQVRKIEQQLSVLDKQDQRVAMALKTQLVLDEYLAEMKTIKIAQLEEEVARFFNLLCRKQALVKEVRIDPQTYSVMLYGSNRTPIATSELSAGEKQLYAMSLLWALRAVSGRAFPIIVDTPMGRLDSEHRQAMLTRFFPHAAHQVVLLATDTEVVAAAFATLQPAVSHRYDLEFDQEQACTRVQRHAVEQTAEAMEVAA